MAINETHDPSLRSWVESANDPGTDFPIQNLPFVFFQPKPDTHDWGYALGVAIGDRVVDMLAIEHLVHDLDPRGDNDEPSELWQAADFANFADLTSTSTAIRAKFRAWLSRELSDVGAGDLRRAFDRDPRVLRRQQDVQFYRPETMAPNYTDFYASIHHAATVGSMFRPDNPLLPNYKHVPIGYHGRASSIVISGTDVRRPRGQQSPPDNDPSAGPSFGPSKLLDYELEVGLFVGPGNPLGEPIPIDRAEEHIFGLCLVNDWSARDLQKWEYQPLGPFLAKNFATTVSPFVVTLEALEPFRVPAYRRPDGDPKPLPYLHSDENQARGGFDITLEVHLQSDEMRKRGMSPVRLSKGNAFKDMYWTLAQLLTHHASNGCNLQPGDLLASGTISGPTPDSRGCLLELTWDGAGPDGKPKPRRPIHLPSGEARVFLQDGDEVIMSGYCEREGFRRIGFGECRGRITS